MPEGNHHQDRPARLVAKLLLSLTHDGTEARLNFSTGGKVGVKTHSINKPHAKWKLVNPRYTNLIGTTDNTHHWRSGSEGITVVINLWEADEPVTNRLARLGFAVDTETMQTWNQIECAPECAPPATRTTRTTRAHAPTPTALPKPSKKRPAEIFKTPAAANSQKKTAKTTKGQSMMNQPRGNQMMQPPPDAQEYLLDELCKEAAKREAAEAEEAAAEEAAAEEEAANNLAFMLNCNLEPFI